MDPKELQALISLLDDPDSEVFNAVNNQLIGLGVTIIPELEKAWENPFNDLLQQRIENIIHNIQFDYVKTKLTEWNKSDHQNLLEGAFYIAKYQYPDLEFDTIHKKIDAIRQDVWLELNNNLTALEKVKILNHIIFEVHGFTRNSANVNSAQNSYINYALEEKKGNPIILAIVYAYVAQQLGLPIYGVNLPKNFILAYKDAENSLLAFNEEENDPVLFYINPFNKGAVFGKREIEFFVKQHKLESNRSLFLPCSNVEVIRQLIITLINAYEKLGYPDKIADLEKLLATLDKE